MRGRSLINSILLIICHTLYGNSTAQECTGKAIRNGRLDTNDVFDMRFEDQIALKISIPEGYIENKRKVIEEKRKDIKENGGYGGNVENLFAWSVRINITGATPENPVLILIKDGSTEKSFKLPYTRTKDRSKKVIEGRSTRLADLCPKENLNQDSVLDINFLSTSNSTVQADVLVKLTTPWLSWDRVQGQEKKFETTGNLSLAESVVRKSFFSKDVLKNDESILITLEAMTGSDCFCNLVSIQQPGCPYFDSVSTAVRYGIWQTMMNKTSLQIQSSDFPNGYLIVLVAAESDQFCQIKKEENKCGERDSASNFPKKYIKITESVNTHSSTTWKATLVIIGVYAAITLITVGLSIALFRYDVKLFEGMKEMIAIRNKKKINDIKPFLPYAHVDKAFGVSENGENGENSENSDNVKETEHTAIEQKESYVIDETDVTDVEAVNISRLKSKLYVSDLCVKLDVPDRSKSIYQKSNLYMGNFLLMSVFYSLAVLQLAFQSAAKQSESGNNDICYYNSLCQKPLGPFLDFNHFFSNLGYVVFGVLFNCIVYFKHKRFEKCKESNKDFVENKHGIPHQYGIYYTMGGALAMEGLMSACYHVCPTSISFQFDTTFMYLMAILMYIKLYQNRHPDISSNSLQAYLVLGAALILEAVSIYYSSVTFWAIFCTIYILSIILVAANIYNLGAVRHDRWLVIHVLKLFASEVKKLFRKRQEGGAKVRPLLVFLALTCGLNFLLCILFAVKASSNKSGASNYLLVMFMANMFVYLTYYIFMKFKCGERPVYQTYVYVACAAICAMPAMYYFTNKEKNSEVSPAESRDINRECILLDYFDGHDVWHFLGGAGVFFTFMFIFTIDEDLKYKKRSEIRVF